MGLPENHKISGLLSQMFRSLWWPPLDVSTEGSGVGYTIPPSGTIPPWNHTPSPLGPYPL